MDVIKDLQWIEFVVLGKPQPAGSKRPFAARRKDGSYVQRADGSLAIAVVDANKNASSWKQEVRKAAADAYAGDLLDCPLEVCMTFVKVRPKSHFRTGRNAHLLREGAPAKPTGKPDVLKLARAVEDALTGVIYRDDALTVSLTAEKRWGDKECAIVRLRKDGDYREQNV